MIDGEEEKDEAVVCLQVDVLFSGGVVGQKRRADVYRVEYGIRACIK